MRSFDELKAQATYWSEADVFDAETRAEVSRCIQAGQSEELEDRFYRNLEFGTGGLRGVLGAGTAFMNIYNIRKAASALARYLKSQNRAKVELKVAISYDSRRFSREFAEASAGVLAAAGIHTFITKELRPVPMLSFMVRHFDAQAGICITASHNPPEYNGFKVYWQHGGQLTPPHDQGIIDEYNSIDRYEDIPLLAFSKALEQGLVTEVGEELDVAYLNQAIAPYSSPTEGTNDLKIIYSPLHGSGGKPVLAALNRFGFKDVTLVPGQAEPDEDFPTVSSPNPEDPAALSQALALARELGGDLVLATDPDADRIGIVVKEAESFVFFNGNELASLLTDYVLQRQKSLGRLPDQPLVIKTIVTSDLMERIARSYGAACEETLTGFKWICELVEFYDAMPEGASGKKQFVCGGEESYGFLAGTSVRDKDAVLACALTSEMLAFYRHHQQSLSDRLAELWANHGLFRECLHTETLKGKSGAERIQSIMRNLRASPPTRIAGQKVISTLDYLNGIQTEQNRILPAANVLQFILQDHTKISVRPSGTEPKIKFYVSVRSETADLKEPLEALKLDSTLKASTALKPAKELAEQRLKTVLAATLDLVRS